MSLPSSVAVTTTALLLASAVASAAQRRPSPAYYPSDGRVELTLSEAKLANQVAALFGAPEARPRLDRYLVDAARRLAEERVRGRDALTAAGVSDAFAIPVQIDLADGESAIGPLRTVVNADVRRAAVTHYGVGIAAGGRRVGLVFVRRLADLSKFPKHLEDGSRYLLNGTLGSGLSDPRILVATPSGRVTERAPRFEHRVFWSMLRFDRGPGRYIVEVQARDRYGTQVLSLLEVWVNADGAPAETPVVRLRPPPRPVRSPEEAARRLHRLVNRSRRRAGLADVRSAGVLIREAGAHAADMAEAGFFGHVSPTRGGLGRRLERAGLRGVLARENIAIATSPETAHAELVRSPSHLRNILDPHVTHLGIGVHQRQAGTQPVYTFTQVFARLR